jgi:4'-phosphopantetheinyl transferase EntD
MSTEREDLARDIWEAGVTDPDLLAAYLIREGWGKRRNAFTAGVVSTVGAINQINPPMTLPLMRGMTT